MTITPNTCIHLLPNQTSSALGNETIILNYEAGNYYELNEVAGAVWASLQAQKSILVHQINSASYWINLRSNPLYANAN